MELEREGLRVLKQIDVQDTTQQQLGVSIPGYRILAACCPELAYEVLRSDERLVCESPCNVVVQENGDGSVHVAAADLTAALGRPLSPALSGMARDVQAKLDRAVESTAAAAQYTGRYVTNVFASTVEGVS